MGLIIQGTIPKLPLFSVMTFLALSNKMFRSNKYHVLARLYAESPLVVNWTRGTSEVSFKEKGKGMCLENRKTGWWDS